MLKDGDLQNYQKFAKICALLHIYTTNKIILNNIFHWNLLAWQEMQKERDFMKRRDLRRKICNCIKFPALSIVPFLCCTARYFHTTDVVKNEVLPVFVAINYM